MREKSEKKITKMFHLKRSLFVKKLRICDEIQVLHKSEKFHHILPKKEFISS
jgi:hypothetical protein